MTIPPGATAPSAVLSVGPATASSSPVVAELLPNTAFAFGPGGTVFASPLTISIRFDPAGLTPAERGGLAIYLAAAGSWEEVPGSIVNANATVTAEISHFSSYAILKRAAPATITAAAGADQSATVGTKVAVSPAVVVRDAKLHPVKGVRVTFAVASGDGTVDGPDQTTTSEGLATLGSWTLGAAPGANSITASVDGLAPVTFTAMAVQSVPVSIAIATQPAGGVSGKILATGPVIELRDAQNAVVAGATNTVTVVLGSGNGSLSGTTSLPAVNGVASFADLKIAGKGAHTLAFSSSGLTAKVSAPIDVVQQNAALAISRQPAVVTVTGEELLTQPQIEVRDHAGLRVTDATIPIIATLAGQAGSLGGIASVAAVAGVATFSNLAITGSGSRMLSFSAAGLEPVISAPITVQVPSSLAITGQPGGAFSDRVFQAQPVVEIRDASGVKIPSTAAVTATLSSGTGVLLGTASVKAVEGAARFDDLKISGTGPHVLSFSAAGVPSQVSAPIEVAPPPIVTLVVGTAASQAVVAGTQILIPVTADMSAAGGRALASLTFTVTWDTARFTFVSAAPGTFGSGGAYSQNTGGSAGGSVTVSMFDNVGITTESPVIYTVALVAKAAGTSVVTLESIVAGDAAGNAISSLIAVRPFTANIAITNQARSTGSNPQT
jgi:hypothetical protein